MRATENYELNLLDAEDFVNREVLNENTEKIDEVLKNLEEPEHDATKQTEVEELESGESLKVALRKLAKAVADYISHKADKVAHITAEERTAWNAKLGTEKIAANLVTDTDGMVLAAAMGKNLKEQIDANANSISTLNSNIDALHTSVSANSCASLAQLLELMRNNKTKVGVAYIGNMQNTALKEVLTNPFANYTECYIHYVGKISSTEMLELYAVGAFVGKLAKGYVFYDGSNYVWSGWTVLI